MLKKRLISMAITLGFFTVTEYAYYRACGGPPIIKTIREARKEKKMNDAKKATVKLTEEDYEVV